MPDSEQPSTQSPPSPYECTFCDEFLTPVPAEGWSRMQVLLLTAKFQCPHCFTVYRRPIAWLAPLTVVARFFRFGLIGRLSGSSIVEQHRAEGFHSLNRRLSRLGRWFQHAESRIYHALGRLFRLAGRLCLPRSRRGSESGRYQDRTRNSFQASYYRRRRMRKILDFLLGRR